MTEREKQGRWKGEKRRGEEGKKDFKLDHRGQEHKNKQ